jgi:hypothetical protein
MAKGSHVIDVGSATASEPGHWANRLVNASIPAKLGDAANSSTTSPFRPACGRLTTT